MKTYFKSLLARNTMRMGEIHIGLCCENLYLTRDNQTFFEVSDDYPINYNVLFYIGIIVSSISGVKSILGVLQEYRHDKPQTLRVIIVI